MRSLVRPLALLLVVVLPTLPGARAADDKVDVKVVKYAGLADTINKLKGKVVVVDFWMTT